MHRSYHSSRGDTKSCYQSSRSREIEIAFEKHRNKRESSRRTKALSESEGIAGGHWKSKPKKQKSIIQDNLSQPWESINSYDELRKEFLEKYLQQKKCIKDPVEIHNIKQRDGESTKKFVRRETARSRTKAKPQEGKLPNQQRTKRKQDRFTLVTNTPKEILALEKWKFKPHQPMTTSVEKRNTRKFSEFHGEVGHTIEECMHLKRKIKEMDKAEKLSHLIKELKQKITQSFSPKLVISFLPLREEDGIEGPMIIKAEMGGHCVHRMYVDEGSSSEYLYKDCFNRFHPDVKNQMIPATTPLVGFSGEIIWPRGQISLLVKIGDEEDSTYTWMNFMVVRSPSPYKGIIGRPRTKNVGKRQILADFIMKRPKDNPRDITMEDDEVLSHPWMLFTDGSCSGLLRVSPDTRDRWNEAATPSSNPEIRQLAIKYELGFVIHIEFGYNNL
nr:hypothetical protein [Tanacetum cinerariifolium]